MAKAITIELFSANCSQVQVTEGHNSGAPPNSNSNSLDSVLLNFSETSFALNSSEAYFALNSLKTEMQKLIFFSKLFIKGA